MEGFLKAEQSHGVRYMRFVGDGDSSVFPTLRQSVPVWGRDIQKIECTNHACKCYRSSLEKLVADNPSYKRKGGLTEKMRKRLTCAARCAIKMRSKNSDTKMQRNFWNVIYGMVHFIALAITTSVALVFAPQLVRVNRQALPLIVAVPLGIPLKTTTQLLTKCPLVLIHQMTSKVCALVPIYIAECVCVCVCVCM